jgi:hypothetical protein
MIADSHLVSTMEWTDSTMQLDRQVCERARLARDHRFDGLFFTGVHSTGVFCRPICPAPAPRPENIVYYPCSATERPAINPPANPGTSAILAPLAGLCGHPSLEPIIEELDDVLRPF